MKRQVFKDNEIAWFYWIVLGLLAVTFLLIVTDREWLLSLIPLLFMAGFAYLGWPIEARIVNTETIVFKGLLRTSKITTDSIVSVRAVGAYDYRAHIVLRSKNHLPVGYRCRKYANSKLLAQAVLNIIKKSSKVKVQADALKLLERVATGVNKPLK